MNKHKLILPISILLGCIILGGFIYTSQLNKQKSIEKQQQIDIQASSDKKQPEQARISDIDLQQKCADSAKNYFNSHWRKVSGITISLNYQNHYNGFLDKCFILVETDINEVEDGAKKLTNYRYLFDVYENLQYGFLKINNPDFECEIQNVKCDSIGDFQSKVKPYMAD